MTSNFRKNLLPTLARTSPVIFPIFLVLNCVLYPSFNSYYIFIMYFIINLTNFLLKNIIFKPIYTIFEKINIPILGRGIRPDGANSCHFILDNIDSKTFGMPSGHSQIAWAMATYFILKIIFNYKNKTKNNSNNSNNSTNPILKLNYLWIIISCILIYICAVYISYSRVYIEGCHTIQQVIFGSLFGIISGGLVYYYENDIKILLKL